MSWLEKKVGYCRDHLNIQAKLAPGLSEYCAYISGLYILIDKSDIIHPSQSKFLYGNIISDSVSPTNRKDGVKR